MAWVRILYTKNIIQAIQIQFLHEKWSRNTLEQLNNIFQSIYYPLEEKVNIGFVFIN